MTTIVRSIALGEIRLRDGWRVLGREAGTGLLVGVLIAIVAFGRSLLVGRLARACRDGRGHGPRDLRLVDDDRLGHSHCRTTLGVDPAVLSGPLITTFVDATGLVIYFTIAKMILHI